MDKEMRKKPKAKYSAKRDGDRAVFDIVCDLRKQKNGDKFIRLYDKAISVNMVFGLRRMLLFVL